jgi:multidrug efflux pump subunit AcrA (membrane-fusion protein)
LPPTTPSAPGFIVKVEVPNADRALLPGMAVAGRVAQAAVTGVAVPVGAFLDDTHQTLMTVQDGAAHLVHVQELANDGRFSVIGDLPEGTTVVADGNLNLTDGQKVSVR